VCFEGGAEKVEAVSWNRRCESERGFGRIFEMNLGNQTGESVGIVEGMGQK
jgi:hypothetical protein